MASGISQSAELMSGPGQALQSRTITTLKPADPAPSPLTCEAGSVEFHSSQRMNYGDAIRVIGTIAVVLGHVCDPVLFNDPPRTLSWWVSDLLDASCRWAVPVYIMLSGALLLGRDESPSAFYRKRLARLGIPLIFWSAFFLLFARYYTHEHKTWRIAFVQLALGEPYLHMHFIFRIAGLYALTPALRILVRHCPRPTLWLTIGVLTLLWAADSFVNGLRGIELSAFARFAPFLSFYLGGYLLRETYVSRKALYYCFGGVLLGAAILVGWSGLFSIWFDVDPYPSIPALFYDFVSPIRVMMGFCAFILLVNLFHSEASTRTWFAKRCAQLAPATLGIYLIHPVFRDILLKHGYYPTRPSTFIALPLFTVIIYALSVISVLLLMKTPYLRRIVT